MSLIKGFQIKYPGQYKLLHHHSEINLTNTIGKYITLKHNGKFGCSYCERPLKKLYQGGYCFPCMQNLARCDLCVLKPELCHFHLGTCREPDWGLSHCMQPHIVYISFTSGLKVGLTRKPRLKNRWLEQGALGGCALVETKNRFHAGLIESHMAKSMQDKTSWRKMLACEVMPQDIWLNNSNQINEFLSDALCVHANILSDYTLYDQEWFPLDIDICTPQKIKSIKPKADEDVGGVLRGFRGHYMVFDHAVVNMRALAGYDLDIEIA